MPAARSDDEEAVTKKSEVVDETDTMAAAMSIATQAILVQRRVGEDGRSKAEYDETSRCEVARHKKQSSYSNDPRWNQRRTGVSQPWCRARDARKQKREDRMSWYSVSASEDEDGGREPSVEVPPEIVVEREEEEDKRETDKLAVRAQRLEEQMGRVRQRMSEAVGSNEASMKERRGEERQRWKGALWVKVVQQNLNCRRRWRISGGLRRGKQKSKWR